MMLDVENSKFSFKVNNNRKDNIFNWVGDGVEI